MIQHATCLSTVMELTLWTRSSLAYESKSSMHRNWCFLIIIYALNATFIKNKHIWSRVQFGYLLTFNSDRRRKFFICDTMSHCHNSYKVLVNTQLPRVLQTTFKVTKEQHRYKEHKYAIPFSTANVHCLKSECVSHCLNGGLAHPLATDCPRWWHSHGFQLMLVFKYCSLWWRFITLCSTLHQNKANVSITFVFPDESKICILLNQSGYYTN